MLLHSPQEIIIADEDSADRADAHSQDNQKELQPFQDAKGSEQRGKHASDYSDDPALRPKDVIQCENSRIDVTVIGGPLSQKEDKETDKTQSQVLLGDNELREPLVVDTSVHGQNGSHNVEESAGHHGYTRSQENVLQFRASVTKYIRTCGGSHDESPSDNRGCCSHGDWVGIRLMIERQRDQSIGRKKIETHFYGSPDEDDDHKRRSDPTQSA